jgi:hypothetical protein
VQWAPLGLWLLGSVLASRQVLTQWTWLDFNDQDDRFFFKTQLLLE